MELKVEGRPEVEPRFPSWMSPDPCGRNRCAVDFALFPFDAGVAGMGDLPLRSMRLEIAVNLAMAVLAASNSRAPVHPCVPLASCFLLCAVSHQRQRSKQRADAFNPSTGSHHQDQTGAASSIL